MKYVLDSNIAFKWVVAESDSTKATRLRNEFRQGQHELLTPDVFTIEIAHALTLPNAKVDCDRRKDGRFGFR